MVDTLMRLSFLLRGLVVALALLAWRPALAQSAYGPCYQQSTAGCTLKGPLNATGAISNANGLQVLGGTLSAYGGNFYIGAEVTYSNITGTENTFGGDRAGGAFTGGASFNTAFGHNACGLGGAPGTGNDNACFGTDALRNMNGGDSGMAAFGANALYSQTNLTNSIAAFGFNAGQYSNTAQAPAFLAMFGPNACRGANSTTNSFYNGTCVGPNTGEALTSAHEFLILGGGYRVGATTFASGLGVILIGSGSQVVDTPAAGTANYINLENILTVTGTNTPSTSTATFAGNLSVTAALNGITALGQTFANNGNVFLYTEGPSGLTGTNNTLVGNRVGGNFTGLAGGNTVMGQNGCGYGGTTGAGVNNSCYGVNAAKALNGGSSGIAVFGANALETESFSTSGAAVFGTNSAQYLNINQAPLNIAIFGPGACPGANGTAAFRDGTCLGAKTGSVLTSAFDFLLVGENTGNATFASGTDVALFGTGASAVDTPAAGTSHYVNMFNVLTMTGIGTPSTSNVAIAGTLSTNGYTVSTLPAGVTGASAYVTDATACTFGSTPTGSGTTFCPVRYNGTAWVAG